jgi:hypothetical protein
LTGALTLEYKPLIADVATATMGFDGEYRLDVVV